MSEPGQEKRNGVNWLRTGGIIFAALIIFWILTPTTHGPPHRPMPIVQAKRTATELRNAVQMYFVEYKKFPELPSIVPGKDALLQTDASQGLISVLIPMPDNRFAQTLNRRQIAFFSDRVARREGQPGIWRDGANASLRDPWGNFYVVVMDTNGDGKVEFELIPGTVETIPAQVAVISFGPNGVPGGDPRKRDDDIRAH